MQHRHRGAERGVIRQTAARWVDRYRAGGPAELQRSARRRRGTEETRHAVLTAPLWMPTARWSSRSIAAALGVSQSFVTRTWAQSGARTALTDDLDTITRGRAPELLALLVTPDYAVVVLQHVVVHVARRDSALPANGVVPAEVPLCVGRRS